MDLPSLALQYFSGKKEVTPRGQVVRHDPETHVSPEDFSVEGGKCAFMRYILGVADARLSACVLVCGCVCVPNYTAVKIVYAISWA